MKTQIRSLLALVCAGSASLLIICSPARAGYIVTLEQVGANVVATGTGPIDLTGLGSPNGSIADPLIGPSIAEILTGPTNHPMLDLYPGTISGPASFGSGAQTGANSGSGDFVGLGDFHQFLLVPHGYVSGSALSDSMTFNSATLASLGATPGMYEWTWGTGPNQNFTVDVVAPAVPDTGSTLALLALALAALFGASRFRALRLA